MKNKSYIFILIICMIFQVSCNNVDVEKPDITLDPIESPSDTDNQEVEPDIDIEPIESELDAITIYLPTLDSDVNYSSWTEYFNKKFDLNIAVSSYLNFTRDIESDFVAYSESTGFHSSEESIERKGLYLLNLWTYYYNFQMRLNYLQRYTDYEYKEDLIKSLWQPYEELSVIGALGPEFLNPYTDEQGNIWALPYEYKYPNVKVRKYNKEILLETGREVPETLEDLFDLLMDVKENNEVVSILPKMQRGVVFSGFEDIVNAFGIKTSDDVGSFYSIQFDESIGNYTDIAFDEKMIQCIDYFTALINNGLIVLENGPESSNENFYDGLVFSVYEEVDDNKDIKTPYSVKLYAYEYEPKLYFQPTRYVYILGRDIIQGPELNDVLSTLYLNENAAVSARYGKEGVDYSEERGQIVISAENFDRAPKLIGIFPDDEYVLSDISELAALKNQITSDNLQSGYYKALTPLSGAMEAWFNNSLILGNEEANANRKHFAFVHTFYQMLSEHFFNKNRPSTEEFLWNYRLKMRELAEGDVVQKYIFGGMWIEMEFIY